MHLCELVNVIATGSKKHSQRPLRAFGLNSIFNQKSLDCANFTCAEFLEVPHIFSLCRLSLITLKEFFHWSKLTRSPHNKLTSDFTHTNLNNADLGPVSKNSMNQGPGVNTSWKIPINHYCNKDFRLFFNPKSLDCADFTWANFTWANFTWTNFTRAGFQYLACLDFSK